MQIAEPKAPTVKATLQGIDRTRGFIGTEQLSVIDECCKGEERNFFRSKLIELGQIIETMPKSYETEGMGDQAIANLHYFTGGCDWYIVEKDAGAADDEPQDFQSQAYGLAIIHEAEMGYISIPEILSVGAELDLHWTPRSIESIAMGAKA